MDQLSHEPTPFQILISDEPLRDLRERLTRVRWPDDPPGAPWSTGTSVDYLKRI
jgi:microsomal epoxide hydrolase